MDADRVTVLSGNQGGANVLHVRRMMKHEYYKSKVKGSKKGKKMKKKKMSVGGGGGGGSCNLLYDIVAMPQTYSNCISTIDALITFIYKTSSYYDIVICPYSTILFGQKDFFIMTNIVSFKLRCGGKRCILDGGSATRQQPMFHFSNRPVTIKIRGIRFQNIVYNPTDSNLASKSGAVLFTSSVSTVVIESIRVINVNSPVSIESCTKRFSFIQNLCIMLLLNCVCVHVTQYNSFRLFHYCYHVSLSSEVWGFILFGHWF